ncbi:MAG: Lrp/AsnC family transcriptional regulator [Methanobacteriota archaeon]|nr:MAG: Lrp/AsnC family transcriptional regulator [Euryarchaeota archaeon]
MLNQMMIKLDELDFLILKHLRENSQEPLTVLQEKLGHPKSTIHTRIKRLQKAGIIKRYGAYIDMNLLNWNIIGFVLLTFDQAKTNIVQEDAARVISKLPQVEEVHIIAGQWDILCKIRSNSITALGDFVIKELKGVEGISSSLTLVVLKTFKEVNDPPYILDTLIHEAKMD